MDKAALLQLILRRLEAELAVLVAAAHSSKDQATDAESKPDGKYDMAGQSAAYLAAGQAKLATELAEAISAYRLLVLAPAPPGGAAGLGDVVTLEGEKQKTVYFIGPARGGIEIEWEGRNVTVITAVSPLGRQLLGRRLGETVTLPGPRPPRLAVTQID
jgi:transcription elongation GreA/GreB family factor